MGRAGHTSVGFPGFIAPSGAAGLPSRIAGVRRIAQMGAFNLQARLRLCDHAATMSSAEAAISLFAERASGKRQIVLWCCFRGSW
jgi:hypothetical protein